MDTAIFHKVKTCGMNMEMPASESSAPQDTSQADGSNNIQKIQNEFDLIAKRVDMSSVENKEFLESNYTLFTLYLEESFGITSGKLRESFG